MEEEEGGQATAVDQGTAPPKNAMLLSVSASSLQLYVADVKVDEDVPLYQTDMQNDFPVIECQRGIKKDKKKKKASDDTNYLTLPLQNDASPAKMQDTPSVRDGQMEKSQSNIAIGDWKYSGSKDLPRRRKNRKRKTKEEEEVREKHAYGTAHTEDTTSNSDDDEKEKEEGSASDSSSSSSSPWSGESSSSDSEDEEFCWKGGTLVSNSIVLDWERISNASAEEVAAYRSYAVTDVYGATSGEGGMTDSAQDRRLLRIAKERRSMREKVRDGDESEEADDEDDDDEGEGSAHTTDWNKRFQRLLEEQNDYKRYAGLEKLEREFLDTASLYGKIIITELPLPVEKKTIRPADVGGIAGGEKFIFKGIFFKLAQDFEIIPGRWMYGGGERSDEKAIKASGHELKSLLQIYNAHVPRLNIPLTCTVDYNGFRLLCTAVLPINKTTLRYGSNDGGKTVRNEAPKLRRKIKQACKWLNLRKHMVAQGKYHYGPGDLEGHKSADGQFYVVDLARLFPPEAPSPGEDERCIFYCLLRPELVRRRKHIHSLSSDAFSLWGKADPQAKEYNLDVVAATQYLHNVLIKKVAKKLDNMVKKKMQAAIPSHVSANSNMPLLVTTITDSKEQTLSYHLHRKGVNMRHLGRVRFYMQNPHARKWVLEEMVARVFKNELRSQLREHARGKGQHSAQDLNVLLINFINTFMRHNPPKYKEKGERRPTAWLDFVTQSLEDKFGVPISQLDLKELLLMDLSGALRRFCEMMEINIRKRVFKGLAQCEGGLRPAPVVVASDLLRIGTVVKHMNITTLAKAMMMCQEAQEMSWANPQEAGTLLAEALFYLDGVTAAGMNDISIHLMASIGHRRLGLLMRKETTATLTPLLFGESNKVTAVMAIEYQASIKAIKICLDMVASTDEVTRAQIHKEYALTLLDALKISEAMEQLEIALKLDPLLIDSIVTEELVPCSSRVIREDLLKSINIMRVLLRLFPKNAALWVRKGKCLGFGATSDQQFMSFLAWGKLERGMGKDPVPVIISEIAEAFETALSIDPECMGDYAKQIRDDDVYNLGIYEYPCIAALAMICKTAPRFTEYLANELRLVKHLHFVKIVHGFVSLADVKAEDLTMVHRLLPSLESVEFGTSGFRTDEAYRSLMEACPSLTKLNHICVNMNLRGDWIKYYQRVTQVILERGTSHHMSNFMHLHNLTHLALHETMITNEQLAGFLANNPNLVSLTLKANNELTDEAAAHVGKFCCASCPLEYLNLTDQAGFATAGLSAMFKQFPTETPKLRLHTFVLTGAQYGDNKRDPTLLEAFPSTVENLWLGDWRDASFAEVAKQLVARCKSVRRLKLTHCPITAESMELMMTCWGSTLEDLTLLGNDVKDGCFQSFRHTTATLTSLDLEMSFVTNEGSQAVVAHCSTLKSLKVSFRRENGAIIQPLIKNNPLLRLRISTSNSRANHNNIYTSLPRTLRVLEVPGQTMTDERLLEICEACPRLEVLSLDGGSQLTDFSLRHIGETMRRLRMLLLYASPCVSEIGVEYLSGCPRMECVCLGNPAIGKGWQRGIDQLLPKVKLFRTTGAIPITCQPMPFQWTIE